MLPQSVCYAFLDSQNLNLSIREQGWQLDFGRFRRYLLDKYHVVKAFLFIGYVSSQQRLYTSLQENGYELIFKPTLTLAEGRVKGNVDAELVLHSMIEYPNYHQAVIVTGDGDFYCLVEYLKRQGKLCRLLVPNRHKYSALLRRFAGDMAFVSDLREKLQRREREQK